MRDLFIQRPRYYYILFIPFMIAGLFVCLFTQKGPLFLWMNSYYSSATDQVFLWITWLGQGITFLLVSLLVLFFHRGNGILGLVCFGVSSLLAQLFKKVVFTGFNRPTHYFDPDVNLHLVEGIKHHAYHSFPSGHSASVFAMALFLTLVVKNKKWGFVFAGIAIITAYSRVYLAQHFFEDIYAGAFLGFISTILVFLLMEKWITSKKALNRSLF